MLLERRPATRKWTVCPSAYVTENFSPIPQYSLRLYMAVFLSRMTGMGSVCRTEFIPFFFASSATFLKRYEFRSASTRHGLAFSSGDFAALAAKTNRG